MELTLDQALQKGIEAHKAGKVQEADTYYTAILKASPKHPDANHNMGVLVVGVGKVEAALSFFKTALEAKPGVRQYWLSYIDALIKLDRMADAKAVFDQAKSKGAKGDGFDQVESRLGSSDTKNSNAQDPPQEQLQGLINIHTKGHYQEALNQASQLLEQFPNSINLYNIIGAANKGLGKLDEAIAAYNKAIALKPDYAEAHYNMGNALKDQGKMDEAIEAFNTTLSIKSDYAEAYHNLSFIKKYIKDDDQIAQVQELYKQEGLTEHAKCHLSFALAKMYEDIGDMDKFFACYLKVIALRKKLLNYSIDQDQRLFSKLKKHSLIIKKLTGNKESSTEPTPVFILGMPRSGTTLVEQIISSHSEVTGAGELITLTQFGFKLAVDSHHKHCHYSEFRESTCQNYQNYQMESICYR
jgi:tetratricopeptide (TPR) repeat protein